MLGPRNIGSKLVRLSFFCCGARLEVEFWVQLKRLWEDQILSGVTTSFSAGASSIESF